MYVHVPEFSLEFCEGVGVSVIWEELLTTSKFASVMYYLTLYPLMSRLVLLLLLLLAELIGTALAVYGRHNSSLSVCFEMERV